MPRRFSPLVLTALVGVGMASSDHRLENARPAPSDAPSRAVSAPGLPLAVSSQVASRGLPSPPDACAERFRALMEQPDLVTGAPLGSRRGELLARAKAAPVSFVAAPKPQPTTPRATALRARLFSDSHPWAVLDDVYATLRGHPRELRDVFLSDGYLYAAEPALGALLVQAVALSRLFREPELVVVRGTESRIAVRKGKDYVWDQGPERGEVARLWLFDRVAPKGTVLSPPVHFSPEPLAAELGTREIEIQRITEAGVLARLHYEGDVVPAVLALADGRLSLVCESVSAEQEARVAAARDRGRRLLRVLAALRSVIERQIDEALPFDEPKTEEGQQDGKLRPEWRRAYLNGETKYEFNQDRYPVFDVAGRPRVPQVCTDFIFDTWERLAGTWWQNRRQTRARQVGRLNFDDLAIENRRRVEQLVEFARAHPQWFELSEVPFAAQVPYSTRRRFFRRLYEGRADYRPGDVVAILGPRDDEKLHYHSFFVVAADPLTGMPTQLASNAGRPRIRTWEGEMQSAPRRSIVARVRPRLEWLESLIDEGDTQATGEERPTPSG